MKSILAIVATAVTGVSLSSAAVADTYFSGRSVYGVTASPSAAVAKVDVAKSKYLNIRCGDTITFVNGDQQFTWKFEVSGHQPVTLSKIAPANFKAGGYMVYVDMNDMERS